MDTINLIKDELVSAREVLNGIINNNVLLSKIDLASELIADAFLKKNMLFTCGNGGSMCDAVHFAEELSGRYRKNRAPLPAQAISDIGHLSCVANDFGYEFVFSRYIESMATKGDILFALSSSGNSPNIIKAAETASEKKMKIISLTGNDGGGIAPLSDININIEYRGFADRIQEMHIKIVHILVYLIEKRLAHVW